MCYEQRLDKTVLIVCYMLMSAWLTLYLAPGLEWNLTYSSTNLYVTYNKLGICSREKVGRQYF